jgi:hypothetical protein
MYIRPKVVRLPLDSTQVGVTCIGLLFKKSHALGVKMCTPNALARAKSQRKTIAKNYMDLEFNVCH